MIFQPGVLEIICSYLLIEDIWNLLQAFDKESISFPLKFKDTIDNQFRILPGLNSETFQTYLLIKKFGLNKLFLQTAGLNRFELVKFLLANGANINETNNIGQTAIDIARRDRHSEMVKFLESVQ